MTSQSKIPKDLKLSENSEVGILAQIQIIIKISCEFRVANLLGFSFIAINNKIKPIYCNKSNKIQ